MATLALGYGDPSGETDGRLIAEGAELTGHPSRHATARLPSAPQYVGPVSVPDLSPLLVECSAVDIDFGQFAVTAATLTPYAVQFRYPDDEGPLAPLIPHAEEAIRLAEELVQFVRGQLGSLSPNIRTPSSCTPTPVGRRWRELARAR